MKTLGAKSITELGQMLRKGELRCVELTQAVLSNIGTRNSHLGAFAGITAERAIMEAERSQRELDAGLDRGPLHGIPYAIKDLFDVAGQTNSAGTPLRDGNVAQTDAAAVSRLTHAGAVLVGRTHTSPLAATILGINHARGTPRNPWKEEAHLPGGSSSGSAVAVAAGLVPFALGTDTGGSIRVPAALCGVTGLNPTVGRVDTSGMSPLAPSFDSIGPLAHSAHDAALVYNAIQDEQVDIAQDIAGLRIGICETLFFDDAQVEVVTAVLESARALEELGAVLCSAVLPEVDSMYALIRDTSLIASEGYPLHKEIVDHPDSDWVIHWMRAAREYSKERVAFARKRCIEVAARLATSTRSLDAVIVPTTPIGAVPVAACDTPVSHAAASSLLSRNTQIGNLAGWCSLSVPCGTTSAGLPIGLMVYAGARNEEVALRIAHALETAPSRTASTLVPPYSAGLRL